MAVEDQKAGQDQKETRGWDYSSDPLKAGGMQIFLIVAGCLVILVLGFILIGWMAVSHQGPSAAP